MKMNPNESSRRNIRIFGYSVLFTLLLALVALPASSQRRRAPAPGQTMQISALEIQVEDLATRQVIATISPKGTLELDPGMRVRLRMVGVPAGQSRSPRYPSTRFWMEKNSRQVEVERANDDVGAIILKTVRSHEGPGAAPILFEVTDSTTMNARELTGRVYIKVMPAAATPPPTDRRDDRRRDDRRDDRREETPSGVTLYADGGFRGQNQTLYSDYSDLRGTVIGNDRTTSIRVDPGCEAVVYEDINFRGRSAVIRGDAPAIDDLGIGNDTVSSVRVECGDRGNVRGATLFTGVDLSGDYETFTGDDPGLGDNIIGNDRARSIQVDRGCTAILYRDSNFRGRSTEVTRDLVTLGGTDVGNDGATSIRVRCEDRR